MTQYHAIGLLYQMRSPDRMALVKMVQQYGAAGAVKSPAATSAACPAGCQAGGGRRWSAEADDADARWLAPAQARDGQLRGCQGYLRHEDVTDAEATRPSTCCSLFLSSPRPITKFAALRILHNFASFKPHVVKRATRILNRSSPTATVPSPHLPLQRCSRRVTKPVWTVS